MEPMDQPNEAAPRPRSRWIRELFRGHGRAVVLAAAATIAVQVGAFIAARWAGIPPARASSATLAVATLWVAVVSAPLASAGKTAIGSLLRGGVVVDASIPALVVLAAAGPVTVIEAVKVYLILAAVALFAVALVRVARTARGRGALAVTASVLLFVLLASPLWVAGPADATSGNLSRAVVRFAVTANPFYAVSSAVVGSTGFVWHQAPVMYPLTWLGEHLSFPPVRWHHTAVLYGCIAAILGGVAMVRGKGRTEP